MAIQNLGTAAGDATQAAMKHIYLTLVAQAGFLAYLDVFCYCALIAFAFVPFTLFFSPGKGSGNPGAH
jgi:DHA2 family multidrug resistance protein